MASIGGERGICRARANNAILPAEASNDANAQRYQREPWLVPSRASKARASPATQDVDGPRAWQMS